MNVLQLPENTSSQIQISVAALRRIGVGARGLVAGKRVMQSSNGLERCDTMTTDRRRCSPQWFRDRHTAFSQVLSALRWADIVHYHYGGAFLLPYELDVKFTCWLRRPRLINFWGTDIRVAEVEAADNPYFAGVYKDIPKWSGSTYDQSRKLQQFYASRGFGCVIGSETMIPHIDRSLFARYRLARCAFPVADTEPSYPDPEKKRPLLVHSPSDTAVKGTPAVLRAVEELRRRKLDFDFVMIHQMSRSEALETVRKADIFLDQFILGGYGMAAIEAFAAGKPVVCYIKPSMVKLYPSDLPVVNGTIDNLTETLEGLILDSVARHCLGRRGRAYAERYHDSLAVARQLKDIYSALLS
jgi:glycosyltransferase involved in cell wall biosynthesis